MTKKYVSQKEARAIAYYRGIKRLPRINRQICTVPAIASNQPLRLLGHDSTGYWVA